MEQKIIDLNQTVHTLCKNFEGLDLMLKQIGFTEITNPIMLNTAGRFMTLKMGAKNKNISLDIIINHLEITVILSSIKYKNNSVIRLG